MEYFACIQSLNDDLHHYLFSSYIQDIKEHTFDILISYPESQNVIGEIKQALDHT